VKPKPKVWRCLLIQHVDVHTGSPSFILAAPAFALAY
jgi:hypothetical protein